MITKKIVKNQLCVGCGLCASILGEESCQMTLTKRGFYYPQIKGDIDDSIVKKVCPGIRVHADNHTGIWGNVIEASEAWSADSVIRFKAASGGVVTSLAVYLIESKKVDAVLHVGVKEGSYLYNELKVSRSKEDIVNNAQSRYAPALTLSSIIQLLENSHETYAFIGKPCDIAGLKNLFTQYPQYKERFHLIISIFCAGMPSFRATEKTWRQSGRVDEPISLKYRGDGWPGNFKATWKGGAEYKLSYNESWGKILGRDLCFRCKICPDGIGVLADISVGDSWSTYNGYPDFTEQDGRCFVMVRTKRGQQVLSATVENKYIIKKQLNIDKIREMQPYQFQRRKIVGWRILPVELFTIGILDFKGLGYIKQMFDSNFREGIENMRGSTARMIKVMRRK